MKWQNKANQKRATISMRMCGARDEIQPEEQFDAEIGIGRTNPTGGSNFDATPRWSEEKKAKNRFPVNRRQIACIYRRAKISLSRESSSVPKWRASQNKTANTYVIEIACKCSARPRAGSPVPKTVP